MKTTEHKTSVVKHMRDIRNQVSMDIQNMSLQEQKVYMREILKKKKNLKHKKTKN